MPLTNPFKLEKLKIKAYRSESRSTGDHVGTFEAMFNPTSFRQKFEIVYGKGQGFNTTGKAVDYTRSKPSDLNLNLILDGTLVSGVRRPRKVSQRIKDFLDLTYRMNGSIHEPNYLIVEWGDLIYSCRLSNVDISYTSFDRDGTPLRAELNVSLIGDKAVRKRIREENKSSPDVSHKRMVKQGDTLPLLTREIYGTSEHYLRVARWNGLDDFRNLTPGQEIHFPPL